jgi:hypothetical protein
LLSVEVERTAAANPDIVRDASIERRNLKADTLAPTPLANGPQGPFDNSTRASWQT